MMKRSDLEIKTIDFRLLLAAGVSALAVGFGAPALAQQADDAAVETEEATEEEAKDDTIVVTGSLMKRNAFNSASPILVITAEQASLEGLLDTSEMLQSSSIASGSNQINSQRTGFITQGGTGVNSISLRGLGAQRTLVLVNGRRLGPAGTRGQVGAFDLNVLPAAILQRVEILKDGASSIYGSDAVSGVVNAFTKTDFDGGEINISAVMPFAGGGETYSANGSWGKKFDRGSFAVSAYYENIQNLAISQRDYLSCPLDYSFGPDGQRNDDIERQPGSPNFGNPKCWNALNQSYDVFSFANGVVRHIPDPNLTMGSVPGFRPRGATGVTPIWLENPTDNPKEGSTDALNATERGGFFATAEYELETVEVYAEVLYNRRETASNDWRQFFPWVSSANPFVPATDGFGASTFVARPIALMPFNQNVTVEYYNLVGGVRGDVPFLESKDWTFDAYVNYSNSNGEYITDTIPAANVEDAFGAETDVRTFVDGTGTIVCQRISDGSSCPVINYFSPAFLNGDLTQEELDFLSQKDIGNTKYTQFVFRGIATGEVIDLPAGPVGLAVGAEHRNFEIDDVPGEFSLSGNTWGLTSAQRTAGTDNATELFAELEVPIFKDVVTNGSVRWADYASFGSNTVYKIGGSWAVSDTLRLRSTYGTSYRTPALYELFLGNQTGFGGQFGIDPCIDWQSSQNANIQRNCAADGIPGDYAGVGPSATIITGGGAGVLEAETSDSLTIGGIFTPPEWGINIAIDYFDIEVKNQISRLGASSILGRCYGGDVFPNVFCSLFTRETDPTAPNFRNILTVSDSYVNINSQRTRGLDVTARYVKDTQFGDFSADFSGTWTFEDSRIDFDGEILDFEITDFNGTIGQPSMTGNATVRLDRGNFTYTWFSDYVGPMSNAKLFSTIDPSLKYRAESTTYHGFSVRYRADDWQVVVGMRNIFDEAPPALSSSVGAARRGYVPIFSSQYDIRGRSGFIRLQKQFGGG